MVKCFLESVNLLEAAVVSRGGFWANLCASFEEIPYQTIYGDGVWFLLKAPACIAAGILFRLLDATFTF